MAGYPQDTIKLVYGGKIGGDIWRSTLDLSVTLSGSLGPTAANLNGICATLAPSFATFWTALKVYNVGVVDYSVLQAYWYPLGSTAASASGFTGVSGTGGSASTAQLPLRTCMAVSKLTAFSGRRNRGRSYLPVTAASLTTTQNQFSVATTDAISAALKALIDAINAANLSANAIASQVAVVTSVTGTLIGHPIRQLKADSLPDSQRRRTNKDLAEYAKYQAIA